MANVEIPEDLRDLKDFPMYDTTFQDGPKFRQNLSHWAIKTEKLAASLTSLADAFERFHSSGLEHFRAASEVVSTLQGIGLQFENKNGNTLFTPLQEFSEALNNIWCYYEAFLGQTLMLNAQPIRDLAITFTNLKKLYDQLLDFRKTYVLAAEKLCASKHVSRMADRSQLMALAEECYTSHKSYQLVLSKYIKSMRQVHTQEMMNFLRRVIEHLLSLYSYHNFSAQVMKDQEPAINGLFTKAKEWRTYYEGELEIWGQLHHSIQKHVLAEYQHNMGLVPQGGETTPTWTDVAVAPLNVMRKMLPSYGAHSPKYEAPSSEWYVVKQDDLSNLDAGKLSASTPTAAVPKEKNSPKLRKRSHLVSRTMSTPVLDGPAPRPGLAKEKRRIRVKDKDNRKMVKSISDPDILAAKSMELCMEGGGIPNGATPYNSTLQYGRAMTVSQSHDHAPSPLTSTSYQRVSLDESMDDTFRTTSQSTHGTSAPSGVRFLGRSKDKKMKRSGVLFNSLDDLSVPDGAPGTAPGETTRETGNPSPSTGRRTSKSGGGFLKRARDSLLRSKPQDVPRPQQDLSHISEEKTTVADQSGLSSVRPANGKPVIKLTPPPSPLPPNPKTKFEIEKLILPKPPAWTKTGYLWLRMKLPNNRYAWTYIYCVVDRQLGQMMIQEQSLPEPRRLENLLLCTVKRCTPDFIDRNHCFRVISPTSEHLFQTLNDQELQTWLKAVKDGIAIALKQSDGKVSSHSPSATDTSSTCEGEEVVPNAMETILAVPGNRYCADCSSTDVEWASINLGIVLCIACSGVHRGLGVHVSKVRSLNLDKWDRETVEFMQSQGNSKSNGYYEATLETGVHQDTRKPRTNASKSERHQFIQQKYVALAFLPELTSSTVLLP